MNLHITKGKIITILLVVTGLYFIWQLPGGTYNFSYGPYECGDNKLTILEHFEYNGLEGVVSASILTLIYEDYEFSNLSPIIKKNYNDSNGEGLGNMVVSTQDKSYVPYVRNPSRPNNNSYQGDSWGTYDEEDPFLAMSYSDGNYSMLNIYPVNTVSKFTVEQIDDIISCLENNQDSFYTSQKENRTEASFFKRLYIGSFIFNEDNVINPDLN